MRKAIGVQNVPKGIVIKSLFEGIEQTVDNLPGSISSEVLDEAASDPGAPIHHAS